MPGKRRHSLLLTVVLLACATSGDQSKWAASMEHESLDQGPSRTFQATMAKTLQAAQDALAVVGLRQGQDCPAPDYQHGNLKPACTGPAVTKVNEHTSFILGYNQGTSWNGVQVRVAFEELASGATTVRVVSKNRSETIVSGGGDYSGKILIEMARVLR